MSCGIFLNLRDIGVFGFRTQVQALTLVNPVDGMLREPLHRTLIKR